MLSGYPYFSFWGTKLVYRKLDYTFPIHSSISKNIAGLLVQRLYGSAFFEAGCTWNFSEASKDRIRAGTVKRDLGLELRLKTVAFYRLPMFLTAKIAWPLDEMGSSRYDEQYDARRYYFGLTM